MVTVNRIEFLVVEQPIQICAEKWQQNLTDEMTTVYWRVAEVIDGVKTEELIYIWKLLGIVTGSHETENDHDGGEDLDEDEQAAEVVIFEVESFHGEEVDYQAEID